MDNRRMKQLAADLGVETAREDMYDLVATLETNIAAEADARRDYYTLLQYFYSDFTIEEIKQIEEIIAEELKHTEILRDMIVRRTHILAEE